MGIKTKELLQAFLKNKPLMASQVRLKGHQNQGIAASIPKNKPSRTSQVRLKGHKNQGIAASIPKN